MSQKFSQAQWLNPPTAQIGRRDGSVVAEDLEGEQAVVERGAGRAAGEEGGSRGVEDDEIGFLAGEEGADLVGDSEHPGAAGGGEVEGAEGIEAGAAELAGAVGFAERVENRERRAGAD